jgi:hypothetical protein
VQLVSLQKGPGEEQLAEVQGCFSVIDFGPRLDAAAAFVDTAALIANLDVVICSDSAVAHLAGALGAPVWIALPFAPDWRWLQDRQDSPWYPTARLYRQPAEGDWRAVFARMAADLASEGSGFRVQGSERRVGQASRASAGPPEGSGFRFDIPGGKAMAHDSPPGVIEVEISAGELLDKIAILEIKREQMTDPGKLANVARELAALTAARDRSIATSSELDQLVSQLKEVNQTLWHVEDEIRDCERAGDFGPRFIELARSVYRTNDRRAALKRQINDLVGSRLVEEKDYQAY